MLISHKGHTDTLQVYSVTVMTHVKALQAGHSSQGTSEPITPGLLLLANYREKDRYSSFWCQMFIKYPFDIPYHYKMTMFTNILATFTVEKQNIHNWINVTFRNRGHNSSSNRQHRVCSPSVILHVVNGYLFFIPRALPTISRPTRVVDISVTLIDSLYVKTKVLDNYFSDIRFGWL